MSEMSMNKAIHGAFRRDLDRFVSALGSFPPGDLVRAKQLATAWDNFDDQLTHHHTGEHEIAWPCLIALGVSKDLLDQMDAEHETMAAALAQARAAVKSLAATAGHEESRAALSAMEALRAATVTHLDHEEQEIEPVYLSNKDTPEMKQMGKGFAKVSPARGGRFFAWVLDGASPDERAAITGTIPGPVLAILTALFGRGYNRSVAPVWR